MSTLHPCPSCNRHVSPAAACPFCGEPLSVAPRARTQPTHRVRARAAVFLGAALLLPACGDDDSTGGADARVSVEAGASETGTPDLGTPDSGPADTGPPDLGPEPDFGVFPPYGTPPAELADLV